MGLPVAATVSRLPPRPNDRYEPNEEKRYTTSLFLRQQQASAYYRQHLRDYDRPSSSSDSQISEAHSLRRTAKFESKPSQLRSSSVDSPGRSPDLDRPRTRHSNDSRPSHRRATSAHYTSNSYTPHPALRISSRTKAAITYALEVAIRQPNPFTPDYDEEQEQMSSLGGRNGAVGTGGPVPVPSTGTPTGIRTPRDVMRDRNAREARRQEEQKAEEQRRLAEERRRSAERRAAAVGGAAPRFSQASSQYTPESQQAPFDPRGSGGQPVSTSDVLGQPTSRISQAYGDSRTRGPSVTQQDAPRPAPATAGAQRRTQPSQQAPRQPTSSGAVPGPLSQQSQSARQQGAAAFPHAFERWETLSSHWEGLTSYWLHKLEQNTEEIRDTVPNAVTLNRQITDLSAAGANLFHAVVELQRLRASSERKFQRWFFESKANDEKSREIQGQLQKQIDIERGGRDDAARQHADASIQAENARRELAEMRRELMISKDEARRAWEELGRRNQESMETAQNLKDGKVTLVHGVQVVPYFGGPSRSVSAGQRPSTRDGPTYGSTGIASAAGAAGLQSPGDEREYYQENSPTNTDPFMETGASAQPQYQEPKQSLAQGTYQPYNVSGTPTTASAAQKSIPLAGRGQPAPSALSPGSSSRTPTGAASNLPVSTQEAQRFYQHAPQETFLHSAQSSAQGVSGQAPTAREEVRSDISYVDSEADADYAAEQGYSDPYRRRVQSSETDDSYDVGADVAREDELAAQYGRYGRSGGGAGSGYEEGGYEPTILPEAPSVPATSAQAMASYTPTSSQEQRRPSYEGAGYENWESLQTRHHHPTRLSDVLEEEEERSSRRTAGD